MWHNLKDDDYLILDLEMKTGGNNDA